MRWRSGNAAVCKTAMRGFDSRPHLQKDILFMCPGGGTGIRYGLKIRRPQGIEGSIPSLGTIQKPSENSEGFCYLIYGTKVAKSLFLLDWLSSTNASLSDSASADIAISSLYFCCAPLRQAGLPG